MKVEDGIKHDLVSEQFLYHLVSVSIKTESYAVKMCLQLLYW